MKVLTYTRLWPNACQPNHGIFVEERMRRVAAVPGTSLRVVAPVEWFPRFPLPASIEAQVPMRLGALARYRTLARVPRVEMQHGIPVLHPRYAMIPGLGMMAQARSLYAATFPLLRRMHLAEPMDLLDAHFLHPDGWAAVEAAKRLGVPVVLSARGSDANSMPDAPGMAEVFGRTLAGATMLIAVSRGLAARMIALGADPAKVVVVPNGIDASSFSPRPEGREEIRARAGVAPGEVLVLNVGRLERVKGQDVLIDALALAKARPGAVAIKVAIVGDGSAKADLLARAASVGVADRITFVGQVPHAELAQWYSAADLFCLPSRNEGHPNALVEAIACGTPVVSTAVGAAGDVVTERCGRLVPSEDPGALATAMLEEIATPRHAAAIRAEVIGRSWEKVAADVHAVYAEARKRTARAITPQYRAPKNGSENGNGNGSRAPFAPLEIV